MSVAEIFEIVLLERFDKGIEIVTISPAAATPLELLFIRIGLSKSIFTFDVDDEIDIDD